MAYELANASGVVSVARAEWIKTRKELLAQVKRQVGLRLGPEVPELASFVRRYDREFSRSWVKSDHAQLQRAVVKADVVLGADFHAFSQSQRINLRVLREIPGARRVALGMEAFWAHDQVHIDRFLRGELSESAFLEKIRWVQRWGFPYENYRPLVDLAKERGYRIVGLNRESQRNRRQQLERRDRFAAQIICDLKRQEPDTLVYVIMGDLHLAERHLPRQIASVWKGRSPLMTATILQNSEHLYFRLAQAGRENSVEVLKAKGGRFCVLGSPPWVKWQSYLMYLEQTYDRDLEAGSLDFTDNVAAYAVFIARDLGIETRLDEMAVYTLEQAKSWQKLREKLNRAEREILQHMTRNDHSFIIPQSGKLYLSRFSVNHAATLAGQYVHARICDRNRVPWRFPSDFLAAIWVEAVGFFCSKLINHKRKAPRIEDVRNQIFASETKRLEEESLALIVDQNLCEILWVKRGRRRKLKFLPRQKVAFLEAAMVLGAMMGERLFLAFHSQNFSQDELVSALSKDVFAPDFSDFYGALIRRLDSGPLGPG